MSKTKRNYFLLIFYVIDLDSKQIINNKLQFVQKKYS